MKIGKTIIVFLAFQTLLHSQEYQIGQCVYSNAYSGLNLRASPNLKSKIIGKLPFGSEVEVMEGLKKQDKIDGESGDWYIIDFEGLKGYVFGEFLQSKQIFKIKNYCSVWKNITNSLVLNANLIDSLTFNNNLPDQSSHYGVEYKWSNGIQQIEHVEYEAIMSEFVIPRSQFSRNQIINVVLASFDNCNILSESNRKEILKLKIKNQINYIAEFSSIGIEISDVNITFRLSGGP